MGATNFTAYTTGRTVEEAFEIAVRRAKTNHGNSGYSGTIAEKGNLGLIEITVPSSYKGREKEYVERMEWDNNSQLMDKWGPTGYIKLLSYDRKEYVPDKIKRHHGKVDGPRKWESLYMVYADGEERTVEVDFSKFKDEAVKKAVAYTKETECSTSVVLVKRLVNQDPVVFTANMSYKEVVVKNGLTDYIFFGMASN